MNYLTAEEIESIQVLHDYGCGSVVEDEKIKKLKDTALYLYVENERLCKENKKYRKWLDLEDCF